MNLQNLQIYFFFFSKIFLKRMPWRTIIHCVGDKEVADKGLETLQTYSRIIKVSRKTPSHSQGGQSEHNNQL
jgi:hypothetical protein